MESTYEKNKENLISWLIFFCRKKVKTTLVGLIFSVKYDNAMDCIRFIYEMWKYGVKEI